jgi:hypothetical protein
MIVQPTSPHTKTSEGIIIRDVDTIERGRWRMHFLYGSADAQPQPLVESFSSDFK